MTFNDIAKANNNNWSDAEQVALLLGYIENQQSDEAFNDFLSEQPPSDVSAKSTCPVSEGGELTITQGVDEDEQFDNHQNCCMTRVNGKYVVSIAVRPNYPGPELMHNETAVVSFLQRSLEKLTQDGWDVEVFVGPDSDPIT